MKLDFSHYTDSRGGLRGLFWTLCLIFGSAGGAVHAFDLNGDGVINILDVSLVASCYGLDLATNPQCQVADVIGDGVIDISDVSAVASCYGLDPATNPQCQLPDDEAPSLTVSSPTTGASIADDRVLVTGTFSAPPNSAVTVNGRVAAISGNQFYASSIPLEQGENTLSITLATVDGPRLTKTLTITSTGAASLQITTTPVEGLAPLDVSFALKVTVGINIQLVEVDFDGDGVMDFTDTVLPAEFDFNYANPGVYEAEFTITDDTATEYTATDTIVVSASTVLEAELRSVFNTMTDRLRVGAIDGALNLVSGGAYEKYRDIFLALQNDLSTVVDQLGMLSTATLGTEMAEILVIRSVGAEQKAFPVYFLRGADGIWRIDGM